MNEKQKPDKKQRSFNTIENYNKLKIFLEKNNYQICPACKSDKWGYTLDSGIPTFLNSSPDGGFIPIVVIICNNCSNTRLYSSFEIKLEQSQIDNK